jgi:hypothetical protein
MSSRRSSRRNKQRGNGITKANNVLVFKLVDPIIQSLLIIFFVYCLDSDTDIQYQGILQIIIGWQILSCIANFFLNPPDLLKKERIAWFIIILLYSGLYYFVGNHVHERFIVVKQANNSTIPLYDSIFEIGGMIISFWYYVICFREIRAMLTSRTNESS